MEIYTLYTTTILLRERNWTPLPILLLFTSRSYLLMLITFDLYHTLVGRSEGLLPFVDNVHTVGETVPSRRVCNTAEGFCKISSIGKPVRKIYLKTSRRIHQKGLPLRSGMVILRNILSLILSIGLNLVPILASTFIWIHLFSNKNAINGMICFNTIFKNMT